VASNEFYDGTDYGSTEEDIKYEKDTIDRNWTAVKNAIEELYFSKIIPRKLYENFEELNKSICKYIGHIWCMDQCNHLEHAFCSRCDIRASTIEHVKEMKVMFPMSKIGQISNNNNNPVFMEFELHKDK